jgi:hypothetical protein
MMGVEEKVAMTKSVSKTRPSSALRLVIIIISALTYEMWGRVEVVFRSSTQSG